MCEAAGAGLSSVSMSDAPRFEGFADTSGRFFGELALHNDRDWFQRNRERYEQGWLAPMRALLGEVRERLGRAYPGGVLGEPKVFRIHRDVRFSKDKSPYKTNIGGMLAVGGAGGGAGVEVPAAVYFHVAFEEAFMGAGIYGMDGEALQRHRAALLDARRGGELGRIASGLARKGFTLAARESTKRVPAGFDPAHPRADLFRLKGLVAMSPPIDRRLLARRELLDSLTAHARSAAPLVRWLVRNVA